MATRNPLVFVPGGTPVIQELPTGDTLAGSTPGPTGATGATGAKGDKGDKGDTGATGAPGTNGTNGTNGAMSQLAQVITSSSASTITFSTISGSYNSLKIVISGRDTQSASGLSIRMKINSDATSGNYTSSHLLIATGTTASGVTTAASAAGAVIADLPGVLNNANALGCAEILIPQYAATTFQKIVQSVSFAYYGSGPSFDNLTYGFVWKNTAAITDIVLTAGGTAFADGTTATLYGF